MYSFWSYWIIAVLVSIIIFFICRELFCWYWKINEIRDLLKSIDSKLSKAGGPLNINGKNDEAFTNNIPNENKCSRGGIGSEIEKAVSSDSTQIDILKISEKHFNKLIDRTNDRALIVKIKDLYKKENDYYCFIDSGVYGEETKEFIKKYITKTLSDIIKFENRN